MYLIEAVGRRWSLYGTRERSQLFQSVQKELEEQGHCLPVEKIRRKWNNLIVTYKRVKYRGRETGQARTSWEYFEVLVCFYYNRRVMFSKKTDACASSGQNRQGWLRIIGLLKLY